MTMITVQVPVEDVPALTRVLQDAQRTADMAQQMLPGYLVTLAKWQTEQRAATRVLTQLREVTA